MTLASILETAHHLAHTGLLWIGFGTVVGLLAKTIMPGNDKGGALTTLLMGIGGTIVGLGVLSFFWEGQHVTPLSFTGFLAATAGAFLLVFFHRLLQGSVGANKATLPVEHAHKHTAAVAVRR